MERLTKRLASGAADYNYPANCYFDDGSGPDRIAQSAFRQKCIERFAEYEDTDLTPELVQETAKLAIWIHENGLDKIKEWIRADKEGRLIVLNNTPRQISPCDTCESGWETATTTDYDSCFNHCERLAQYRKQAGAKRGHTKEDAVKEWNRRVDNG